MALYQKLILETTIPRVGIIDLVEIAIIAVLFYYVIVWLKDTQAWSLMKGLFVICFFVVIAYILQMNTILWIVRNASVVAITGLVVVFQPELRKALDSLGKNNILMRFLVFEDRTVTDDGFNDKTISEIVKAAYEMGKVKTGALIVVSREDPLGDYIKNGIRIDGLVTSQLLINIFEKNTPLHDGAVLIEGNRVVSATSYLPLSSNTGLSKELGTRHRAAVGVSEVTDAIVVTVSEENGKVSVAMEGKLYRNVEPEVCKKKLSLAKREEMEAKRFVLFRNRKNKA